MIRQSIIIGNKQNKKTGIYLYNPDVNGSGVTDLEKHSVLQQKVEISRVYLLFLKAINYTSLCHILWPFFFFAS